MLEKSGRHKGDFARLLEIFKKQIVIVPMEQLAPFLEKAREISPDANDAAYFALALKIKAGI